MTQINQKELEKFDNSLEKAMEVLARHAQKVVGKDMPSTYLSVSIIREHEDDRDLDSVNCHKWYVNVRLNAGDSSENTESLVEQTFYMDLED